MTAGARRGLSFLLGFGFSLLPAWVPFAAIFVFAAERLRFHRSDTVWIGAFALLTLPALAHGAWRAAASWSFSLLAAWVLYRAFASLRATRAVKLNDRPIEYGLFAGFGLIIGLGFLQIGELNLQTAKTLSQAIVWDSHPALFGHTILLLGSLIAILARSTGVRLGSLGLSALGILVSGNREAAIAWLLVAVFLLFTGEARSLRRRTVELLLLLVMTAVAVGLGPVLGWGRVGFGIESSTALTTTNLLQGTEVGRGDWWDTSWVSASGTEEVVGGEALTVYTVTKRGAEEWLRLQQIVALEAGTVYTVSAWIEGGEDRHPGIQGWGQVRTDDGNDDPETFVLSGTLNGDSWRTFVVGDGEILARGIAAEDGSWRRVYSTFRYDGTGDPLTWYLGLAPEIAAGAGSNRFAGFQLEPGELGPYTPGSAREDLDFGVARLPFWQTALRGIDERPWLGSGPGAFPAYFLENWPNRNRLQTVPLHPHNLYLQVLFERGWIGFVGLGFLLLGLAGSALLRRDHAFLTVLGALLVVNLFDSTLLYGGVLYPLAAIAGWRSSRARSKHGGDLTEFWSNTAVLAALALADYALAVGALELLRTLSDAWSGVPRGALPGSVYLALLLWPAMAWREGLYPGYGMTPPQELRKQVFACGYATLILAAGVLLFGRFLPIPPALVPLLALASAVLAPIARWGVKRALLPLGLWGRHVIILGAGDTGRRVARALRRTPLDGLHPLAFFDDDPELVRRRLDGLRVYGTLADAELFAERHSVRHAIVAIPSLRRPLLAQLIDATGQRFRYVQFVPDLPGLPAEDVIASNLDGMLAIEVRNGLHSRRNRAFKRTIDLLGAGLGTLLLTPLLAAIWLWVRLDSRGPAFYRSPRVGQNGRAFRCLKFRTMYADADDRLEQLMAADPALRAEYERWHKLENDPRVTRAGRLLRRLSLDELPQLFNVLAGEMSLVGPRPYLTRELPDMGERSALIFAAKPGITGYWQVTGRSDVTFEERIEMEAHYVRNWSVWWDVILLVRTPAAVLARRGAR